MTQTILITGGAGFIGSALVRAALSQGHRVVVFDKLTYAGHRQNLAGLDCELIVGDVADATAVRTALATRRFDAIIHAAAESHVDNSIAGAALFIHTNIVGTQVMLEAAHAHWQQHGHDFRFLQVSTDEVYGALGASGHFTLDTPLAPNSPYAASKASADMLVRAWWRTHGLPVLTTRCCNNYGPRQHPEKLIPRMIANALAGDVLPVYGAGDQTREWIHVDDHAAGVLAVLARGEVGGIYHIGTGHERKNLALVQHLCRELARQQPGADYAARITHVTDRLGHDFRYALDLSHTRKAIGFTPAIDLDDGLEWTVAWYLSNPEWIATMQGWRGA